MKPSEAGGVSSISEERGSEGDGERPAWARLFELQIRQALRTSEMACFERVKKVLNWHLSMRFESNSPVLQKD